MGVWSRSWGVTRASFAVIQQDKEMLLFPLLSAVFSVAFAFAMIFPTIIIQLLGDSGLQVGPLQVAALFLTYLGLAFAATFCNTCVVYTTKVRLEGGDATFWQSVRFSLSRAHLILAWSLVSATVGLLLRAIEGMAERVPLVGKILLLILRIVLASAWAILTMFVVPVLVFEGVGPFAAVRRSGQLVRETWGANLRRYFGFALVQFVLVVPAFLGVYLVQSALVGAVAPAVWLGLDALLVLYMFGVGYVFSLASTVYKTALYVYATQGRIPEGFSGEMLQGAFASRG